MSPRSATGCALTFTLVSAIAASLGAQTVCSAASFGSLTADPITITGSWTIGDLCTIDFQGRHVILASPCTIQVDRATILCGRLTMNGNTHFTGVPTGPRRLTIDTANHGVNTGDVSIAGTIDMSDPAQGGDVFINAFNAFTTTGSGWIKTKSTATGGYGGWLSITAGGAVTIGGATTALDSQGSTDGDGGDIDITSVNSTVTITRMVDASSASSDFSFGGYVTISAFGAVVTAAEVRTRANVAGDVDVISQSSGAITLGAPINADGVGTDGWGGWVTISTAGACSLGDIIEVNGSLSGGSAGVIDVAAQTLTATPNCRLRANGNDNSTPGGDGGWVTIDVCQANFLPASSIVARGSNTAGTIDVTTHDIMTIAGTMNASTPGSVGAITLTTRLSAPYSPVLTGSTFTPAPAVVHQPSLSPCLALPTSTLTGTSPVPAGGVFHLQVSSVPGKQLLVVAQPALAYLNLGPLGFTQIDIFTNALPFADPGFFGPPIPGSITDSAGNWQFNYTLPLTPSLAGLSIFVEAYVLDSTAANGVFHQPPYLRVNF